MLGRRDECFLMWDLECSKEDLRAFDLASFSSITSLLKKKKGKGRMETSPRQEIL